MLETLDRTWRTLATGFCFAVFGAGALMLRVLVFPLLSQAVSQPARRTHWARACIHHAFRLFVGLMHRMGVMTWELRGGERLQRQGLLILANHPTLVDVVFLMSFVQRADCIVKGALARNPFTRGPVLAAGYIFNDSGVDLVTACVQSVKAGNNLIIFPEGTRTPRTGHQPLQRGAAHVAVQGGIDVTPVRIRVTPLTLGKGEKWYAVPKRRWHIEFQVDDDIPIAPFLADSVGQAIATRRLTEFLSDQLFRELPRADHNA